MNQYDIAIVGTGIIGLSHAYAAAKRGLKVLILERNETQIGASIRNFGFGVVTGQQSGKMLHLAQTSRNIWGEWQKNAGISLKRKGSLLIARNEAEKAVLEAFSERKSKQHGYQSQLLTEAEKNALYDGRFAKFPAILHGEEDQVLYSREAIPQISEYLKSLPNVTFQFGTLVRDVDAETGELITTKGTFYAEQIIICSGHDYQTLLSEEMAKLSPVTCRLQMLRVRPKENIPLEHALFTGLSCTHYDAFTDLPETEKLRAMIEEKYPQYVENGIHLLITPTPYGDMIIGDSHHYGVTHKPFNSEEIDAMLLQLAEETLNTPLEVIERWAGEYGARGNEPFSIIQKGSKVKAVLMRVGLGMSIGPALGERIIAGIYD
ncbi:TIGR03364 family FAD-dependent oxidoreductase [Ignatzschineria sp. LJL83]